MSVVGENENLLLIDWLTVTSKKHTIKDFKQLLGLEEVTWTAADRGRYGYRTRIEFAHISILADGRDDMGICMELSGQGCRDFETYGTGNYQAIFDEVARFKDSGDMKITRLDVAFDDHTGLLDITQLCDDARALNVVTRWNEKNIRSIYSPGGNSLECGSYKSEIFLRVYDKAAERGFNDGRHWVRVELQFRRERAMAFVYRPEPMGERFCGVLTNYIRFVEPDELDTNRSRWASKEYWANFIRGVQPIRLYVAPGVPYNLSACKDYVYKQSGNAVYALVLIQGLDKFFEDLQNRGTVFSEKYRKLLAEHGIAADSFLTKKQISKFRRQVLEIQKREEEADREEVVYDCCMEEDVS